MHKHRHNARIVWRRKYLPLGEGGRRIVKSSATLFRNKIDRGKIIEAFTGTRVDKMDNL